MYSITVLLFIDDIYAMLEKGGMASIDPDISAAFVTR